MNTLPFSHQPLARDRPSIRLVQVLPAFSPDGLVQCTISHHIIDAQLSYTCLSYMWGEPEPAETILLNGLAFSVRQNLFNFLSLTQTKISTDATEPIHYWIDALCIDQSNVLERNHQVEQMGKIYSSAVCVHIWLGPMPQVKGVVRTLRDPDAASMEEWEKVGNMKIYLAVKIAQNAYWTRAWITQEVLLARHTLVILDTETLHLSVLLRGLKYFYVPLEGPLLDGGFFAATKGDFTLRRPSDFSSWNLVALAAHFRRRKCSIQRDHFYSLFSLCESDPELTINYDSSACELAYQILRRGTTVPCLCSALFVLQMLKVEDEVQAGTQQSGSIGPFFQFECTRLGVGCGHEIGHHRPPSGSADVTQLCEQPSTDLYSFSPSNRFHIRKEKSMTIWWSYDACQEDFWRITRQRHIVSTTLTMLRRPGTADPSIFIRGSGPQHEMHNTLVDGVLDYWTEYVRADGFSAKYNENRDTYTVRVALWALATWTNHEGSKAVSLCARSELSGKKKVYSDMHMRVGNGPWDVEEDESEVFQKLRLDI